MAKTNDNALYLTWNTLY